MPVNLNFALRKQKKIFSVLTTVTCILSFILLTADLYSQYLNIRINQRQNAPNEVTIAINPTNPLNLAAGANISSYYYSLDGGVTWKDSTLRSVLYGVWGDPSVTYDALGNLYFGHLSNPIDTVGYWIDRIIVQKSTDGGKTFNRGAGIGYNPPRRQQDKEWISADITNSPYRNNLYISWTEFDQYGSKDPADSSRILFSRSTDQGESWSSPIVVSDTSGDCLDSDSTDEGAVPAVGPKGEVYLSWAGPGGIKFDRSLDGGKSFGKDVFVSTQPGGWDFEISGIYRANGLPVTLCDVSNSRYRGNIYINWTDLRFGYCDVFIAKSTDGGMHWGKPIKVNTNPTTRDRFFTWASVDPVTGYLWIVYYDRSLTTTGDATDVFVSRSTDGGDTFTSFKVSASSFTPNRQVFFGDYTNIAAFNGKVYPIWTRLDDISLSIWTAIIDDQGTGLNEGQIKTNFDYRLEQNFPNPFNPETTISYSLAREGFVSLRVFNSLGEETNRMVNGFQEAGRHTVRFNAGDLPSGLYFYELNADEFNAVSKMILLK